jgi:hypothetical protein
MKTIVVHNQGTINGQPASIIGVSPQAVASPSADIQVTRPVYHVVVAMLEVRPVSSSVFVVWFDDCPNEGRLLARDCRKA